jgi:hypothetical protein
MRIVTRYLALAVGIVVMALLIGSGAAKGLVPLPDYNEPNDDFSTATALENGKTAWGAITPQDDKDYFYLDLSGSSDVSVDFNTGGPHRDCQLAFLPSGSDAVADLNWAKTYGENASFHTGGALGPGRLFAVVSVGSSDASTLAYMLTITATVVAAPAFPDVPSGSAYYTAVTYLAQKGVVSGYSSGNFGPGDSVTRQQFAKMIVRAVGYPVSTSDVCPFVDVQTSQPGSCLDPNDPFYPDHYIAVAAAHGITVGETATTFGPYHQVTMAQVTTMVVRTAENEGVWDSPPSGYVPPFADFGPPHYFFARTGAAHGLFVGYPGSWTWFSSATRGQCAFFVWKLMLALQPGEPQPLE